MEHSSSTAAVATPTPQSWNTTAFWLAVVALLSLALARLAVWLQTALIAPLGIFPILLGAAIGVSVAYISAALNIRNRPAILIAAIFAAIIVATAEHGLFYLDYRSQFMAKLQTDPKAQLAATLDASAFQPASFAAFMSAEAPSKALLWILDPLAMIAVATITAHYVARPQPAVSSP